MRTFGILLLALAASFAFPARVSASENPATVQARQHYQKARNAYDLGRWDEAIAEYEAAYSLRPDSTFLFNMAQAYRRKGDAQRALDLFRNYLVRDPDSPQRADVEEKIRALKKQIEAEQAERRPSESAPVVPASATPQMAPASLPPTPAAAPTPASAPGPTAAAPTPVTEIAASSAPVPSSEGRTLRITGIVLGGIGAAAIVGGVIMSARAKGLSDEVTSDANKPGGGTFDQSKYDSGKSAETLQWVGYGVGAAALVGGGVLYWLGVHKGSTRAWGTASVAVTPQVGPDRVGGHLLVAF